MNSDVKYRAWDKENKIMFDVVAIRWEGENYFVEVQGGIILKDFVLMESTQDKDKNGKEIYEGDICALDGHLFQVMKYSIYCPNCCEHAGYGTDWRLNFSSELEIIGNVYENPDIQLG